MYITTNQHRTVLYTGMSNDASGRAGEHQEDVVHHGAHFTGQYQGLYIVYYEVFTDVNLAIKREKEIKGWSRSKKLQLSVNLEMRFLNNELAML